MIRVTRANAIGVMAVSVVLGIAILWPFDFSSAALIGLRERTVGWGLSWLPVVRDAVVNFGAFVPLGVVAGWRGRWPVHTVAAFVAPLAACVELLQLWLPGRVISPYDVAFNVAGATGGALLATVGYRSLAWAARRGPGPVWLAMAGTIITIHLYTALQTGFGALDVWDAAHPLQIGNEATGDRPWHGRVSGLIFQAGGRTWTEESFSFIERCGSRDPRATCRGLTWRQAAQPRDLVGAVRASGRVAIQVMAAPARGVQTGPARIVSISSNPDERNLTVGQEGRDLIVRIRRRWGGDDGQRPYYRLANVFASWQTVPITIAADSDSTVIGVGDHRLVDRHDVARQWWVLLLAKYEWRGTGWVRLASLGFWLVLLGPVGAITGASAGGHLKSAFYLAFVCFSLAGLAWLYLRARDLIEAPEAPFWMALSLWVTAEITRRRWVRSTARSDVGTGVAVGEAGTDSHLAPKGDVPGGGSAG